jgi:hypothetical protein
MSTRIRILVALVAILVLVSLPASAAATPRARAAGACPGNVLDRVSGGELSEQIVGHDEGPETELMHLCSSTRRAWRNGWRNPLRSSLGESSVGGSIQIGRGDRCSGPPAVTPKGWTFRCKTSLPPST